MKILRVLRKAKKLSMKELGKIVGVSESTISLYENEKREPDYATLQHIADFFDVSTDYLLGREKEQKKIRPSEDERILSVMQKSGELRKIVELASRLTEQERVNLMEYTALRVEQVEKERSTKTILEE